MTKAAQKRNYIKKYNERVIERIEAILDEVADGPAYTPAYYLAFEGHAGTQQDIIETAREHGLNAEAVNGYEVKIWK